jgi:ABC-type uncharacterized transport system permease subunit
MLIDVMGNLGERGVSHAPVPAPAAFLAILGRVGRILLLGKIDVFQGIVEQFVRVFSTIGTLL